MAEGNDFSNRMADLEIDGIYMLAEKHTEKHHVNRRTRIDTAIWIALFVITFGWTRALKWPQEQEIMVYRQPDLTKRTIPLKIEFYANNDLMMIGTCDLGKAITYFKFYLMKFWNLH